ncbi:MAG: DNA primase [Gammaproteobacteria bacterium]|nr:DNA primase [Gammaproteobacteria bacterium]MBT8135046.1 DNA primase [Gammaproteobacteria bacterium]NNJ50912.1 DNA primase [Gammaproteobacteria bacterium]
MAGLIPQNFIDDLISRSDIVEVINARVPLKRKGKEYTACCPFHNEKTPSFTVSESKQFYYCFGCHAKGNVIGFLMDYEHLSYVDAIESLAADQHLDVPHEEDSRSHQQRQEKQPLYDILKQASDLFQQQLKTSQRAIDYLKQRGLSGEIARQFKIGYAPEGWDFLVSHLGKSKDHLQALQKTGLVVINDNNKTYDRFRDRIIFPITDQRGRIIGFGGRILDQGEPKYLNSPENAVFHKGYELYGLYETKQALRKIDRIIVVEGYMDVVALAQHGINYAVASLGTATTTEQIQKTFRTTHEIIFCYDGDNAGKKAAWRALENTLSVIRDGMVAKFLFLPEKEDPDTMVRKEGKDAFEQRIKNATTLSEFLFENLKAESDISSKEGKALLASKANKLIQKMHNSLFKDLLIEELSSLVGLSQQHLESRISSADEANRPVSKTIKPVRGQLVQNNKTRIAIALLLQNPSLASHYKVPNNFQNAFTKGLPLLYELQKTIDSNPEISPAALLERFRDSEHEKALNILSMLQTPETDNTDNIKEVYKNLIERLHYDDRDEYFNYKINNNEQLTAEEQKEYLELCTK